jgi:hypothetical protein
MSAWVASYQLGDGLPTSLVYFWVIVCRTECLGLRVEGCGGLYQVLVDENVEEVASCCWEEGEQDLRGGRLSICSPQAAANRPKQPTAEILSLQSCEFTLVRDIGLGMGGSFSLVLNSSLSAAVQLGQKEPERMIAKGDDIYQIPCPLPSWKIEELPKKDFPERFTFKEEYSYNNFGEWIQGHESRHRGWIISSITVRSLSILRLLALSAESSSDELRELRP